MNKKYYVVINATGHFVRDLPCLLEALPQNDAQVFNQYKNTLFDGEKIATMVREEYAGKILPAWNGKNWVESATTEAQDTLAKSEAAHAKRAQRNELLAQADIVINKIEDLGGDASAWRDYRVKLREMPEQNADARLWQFPTKPE